MLSFNQWFKNLPKGLALPEYKSLSNHSGLIQTLPLYSHYYSSLLQRDGEKAIPTVRLGDHVNKGDIIARPTSHMALHRHAPTSGEVTAIIEITESHPSAVTTYAIEITADGLDTPGDQFPAISDYRSLSRTDLLKRVFRAGIAGMGGAGFPTEKKLDIKQNVDTLIINGAECEPYITCDDLLMRHHGEDILKGALIFAHLIKAKHILVGIEDNKPEAIAAMIAASKTIAQDIPITIHSMPTQYPMGSRHQIAHYLMGKKPDIHKRSYQSGFVCHNVATAKATYDAVVKGQALTERLITFSGDGIEKPGVYLTKVGTNLADIAQTIGIDQHCDDIIFGGTMMGFSINPDIAKPNNTLKPLVVKRETTSVLAFKTPPSKSLRYPSNEENCIRCGHCADVCPMDLLPQQLQFYGKHNEFDKLQQNRLFDCIECGLCTYVCPSDIPLVQIFQHSKGEMVAERKKQEASEIARIRFETRNARMEAEKAERAKKSAARRAKLKPQKPTKATDKADTTSNDKQDLITAALARTQAKKAQQASIAQSSKVDGIKTVDNNTSKTPKPQTNKLS